MNRNAGLTIAEIVIVLILVGIIAAILFPVFAKARPHPRSSCASNLRQIGLGFVQYTQDYDDYLPPRQNYGGSHGELVSWRSVVYPYIKNKTVYDCSDNPATNTPDIERDGFHRSYAVNSTVVAKRAACGPLSDSYGGQLKFGSIHQPSTVIMITETTAAFNDIDLTFPGAFTSSFAASRNEGALYAGHSGYSNYLFADGHIKRLMPLQTLDMNGENAWTRDGSPFSPTENGAATTVLKYAQAHDPATHG